MIPWASLQCGQHELIPTPFPEMHKVLVIIILRPSSASISRISFYNTISLVQVETAVKSPFFSLFGPSAFSGASIHYSGLPPPPTMVHPECRTILQLTRHFDQHNTAPCPALLSTTRWALGRQTPCTSSSIHRRPSFYPHAADELEWARTGAGLLSRSKRRSARSRGASSRSRSVLRMTSL